MSVLLITLPTAAVYSHHVQELKSQHLNLLEAFTKKFHNAYKAACKSCVKAHSTNPNKPVTQLWILWFSFISLGNLDFQLQSVAIFWWHCFWSAAWHLRWWNSALLCIILYANVVYTLLYIFLCYTDTCTIHILLFVIMMNKMKFSKAETDLSCMYSHVVSYSTQWSPCVCKISPWYIPADWQWVKLLSSYESHWMTVETHSACFKPAAGCIHHMEFAQKRERESERVAVVWR